MSDRIGYSNDLTIYKRITIVSVDLFRSTIHHYSYTYRLIVVTIYDPGAAAAYLTATNFIERRATTSMRLHEKCIRNRLGGNMFSALRRFKMIPSEPSRKG